MLILNVSGFTSVTKSLDYVIDRVHVGFLNAATSQLPKSCRIFIMIYVNQRPVCLGQVYLGLDHFKSEGLQNIGFWVWRRVPQSSRLYLVLIFRHLTCLLSGIPQTKKNFPKHSGFSKVYHTFIGRK